MKINQKLTYITSEIIVLIDGKLGFNLKADGSHANFHNSSNIKDLDTLPYLFTPSISRNGHPSKTHMCLFIGLISVVAYVRMKVG